jgi:hypothetical protein
MLYLMTDVRGVKENQSLITDVHIGGSDLFRRTPEIIKAGDDFYKLLRSTKAGLYIFSSVDLWIRYVGERHRWFPVHLRCCAT